MSGSIAGGEALAAQAAALGPWYHNLHLPDGTRTAPEHWLGDFPDYKWRQIAASIPEDLSGWSALDIGCNAGFYSFQLARRGAHVLGIDRDPRYLAQASWAARQYGLEERIEFRLAQVYDLAHLARRFDLVLFMGVFYHLRYPLLGLDIVCETVDRLLIFQTLTRGDAEIAETPANFDIRWRAAMLQPGWPAMAFVEHAFQTDPTNWWVPNHAAVEAMLRSCGMRVLSCPEGETWCCAPDPAHPSSSRTWNHDEFRAATRR